MNSDAAESNLTRRRVPSKWSSRRGRATLSKALRSGVPSPQEGEAMNKISRMRGSGVWEYGESRCDGPGVFSISLLVQ
jgi:hypothetical protein